MPDGRKTTVLNVDDNEACLYVRSRILRKAGFEVEEAATGLDALRLVESVRPELVVLDVNLPDLHGFEVCRRIKAVPSTASIPVLHLSATFVGAGDQAQGLDSGADCYLTEPLQPEVFLSTVRALLRMRQAEKAARQAAQEWQATFDAISDGVAVLDLDGRVQKHNPAFAAMLGRQPGGIAGRTCYELVPSRGACFRRMLDSGRREREEFSMALPGSDAESWIQVTSDPLRDDAAALAGAVYILRDVTAARRAESTRRHLASIVEHSQDAIISFSLEGIIVSWNPGAAAIYGYSAEEMKGQSGLALFPPEQAGTLAAILARIRKGECAGPVETVCIAKGGERVDVCLTTSPMRDEKGEVTGGSLIIRDISERRRLFEQLAMERKRLDAVLSQMRAGVIVAEAPSGRFILTNARAREISRAPLEAGSLEDYGRFVCFHPDGRRYEPREFPLVRSLSGGEVVDWEIMECHRSDGTRATVAVSSAPIRDDDGNIAAAVATYDDITAHKRADEAMRAALKEKETLLKEIHHRVKNNLQIISSLLNLQSAYIKDPQALAIYRESQNRVRSMALIHGILYQSKNLAEIDFGEYIRSLTATLFRSYGVACDAVSLTADVQQVVLDMDSAIPCGLIINELVSNALKHAFPENRRGHVRIDLHARPDGWLTLRVADDGVGIPEGIDFRNTRSLGLQIVCTLTDQLGGTILLDRKRGTEFRIIFPARRE
jgi:PAS domain S-box-containing protein